MLTEIALIGLSLALLFVGAEGLVRGSAAMALRAGLSPLFVGLTIVAFGTSSPELVVSVQAALSRQGDIAVGNVVGSNIFNIAVILGLAALVCPIPVHRRVVKVDAPIALGVAILLVALLLDGTLGRLEGALLLLGIVAYTWMNIALGRKEPVEETPALGVPSPSRPPGHWAVDVGFVLAGLALLLLGSRLLVENAVSLATNLGVSEAVIGLTIVACGTGMPELATSLVAAARRQPDIAIANVVGSNVFNVLGILGAASLVSPLHAASISMFDYGAMIATTVLLLPLLYTGRLLHRIEGVALLLLYAAYLAVRWPR